MMLPSPPKRPPATHRSILRRWEYKKKFFTASELRKDFYDGIIDYLNEEGEAGWELVQMIIGHMIQAPNVPANYTFIFKREKI